MYDWILTHDKYATIDKITKLEKQMHCSKSVILGLAIFASSAFAAPVVWTVPSTTLSDGTTFSGTFTFDSSGSPKLTNINLVATGTNPGSYTFLGDPSVDTFGQLAASIASGDKVVFISGGGGSSVLMGIGSCMTVTSGLCANAISIANTVVTVSSAPATPQSIPTLSEWGMIFMASLLAMFGIRRMRRNK